MFNESGACLKKTKVKQECLKIEQLLQPWLKSASALPGFAGSCELRASSEQRPETTMLALLLASLCLGAEASLPASLVGAAAKPQLLSWNGKPTLCLGSGLMGVCTRPRPPATHTQPTIRTGATDCLSCCSVFICTR